MDIQMTEFHGICIYDSQGFKATCCDFVVQSHTSIKNEIIIIPSKTIHGICYFINLR